MNDAQEERTCRNCFHVYYRKKDEETHNAAAWLCRRWTPAGTETREHLRCGEHITAKEFSNMRGRNG